MLFSIYCSRYQLWAKRAECTVFSTCSFFPPKSKRNIVLENKNKTELLVATGAFTFRPSNLGLCVSYDSHKEG